MRKTPIPDPRPDVNSLVSSVRALKEAVELALGIRGQLGETKSDADRPQAALTRDDIRNAASYGELRDKLTNTTRQSAITEENPLGYATETAVTEAVAAEETARATAISTAVDDHNTAKHPDVADGTLLGNTTGSAAQPVAQTLSAFLDAVIGSTQGGLLVRDAGGWGVLAAGAAEQLLTAQGAGATPAWADPPSPGLTTVLKTADQSISSSTTLVDDSELTFEMAANTTYIVECRYAVSISGGGYKIACNGPAGVSSVACFSFASGITEAYNSPITQNTGSATQKDRPQPGILVRNGATAGTFAMRIAQYTSSSNATVFMAGSYLKYAVVA